jgi:hypothetical protein
MSRPTFARALLIFFCGILMAFFGCAGFLNFGAGYSSGAKFLGGIGAVMFGIGVLASVVGGVLIIGLAFWALVNVLNNWIGS